MIEYALLFGLEYGNIGVAHGLVGFSGSFIVADRCDGGAVPQAAVLYEGDRVLGGGWIEETVSAALEAA